jgi:hypothetical protein
MSAPGNARGQADSFSRPLRRRAAKIDRPARVRMRSRNPCVRARRRLFGWKVRLPLLTTLLLHGLDIPAAFGHRQVCASRACPRTCTRSGHTKVPAASGGLYESTHPLGRRDNRPPGQHARGSSGDTLSTMESFCDRCLVGQLKAC